ncbi:ABC transporter substrate-binding protein [Rudanella lutea]|uniref:ABC transporter substrate-binding protein n=1 Tax=Rudanella lutea TaxID=451374 RepID=UPI00037BE196|nr:ABC transporter substrate-binding protein [Rudanella lutea]
MDLLRLALDWTPNTNHTGFYVASALGYYRDANLTVEITSPDVDKYKQTPARRLAKGEVDLAVVPSESVISFHTTTPNVPLVAVAAMLARDASAIVTLQQSGLERPAQLDGKVYGSYGARFEDDIVRQMIRNDGGRGVIATHKPTRLNLWQALLTNEIDATWIFLPWEGVEATLNDVQLNRFLLDDYEIPYGYSPLLATRQDLIDQKTDVLQRFVEATAAGFRFAVEKPDEAAHLLCKTSGHPTLADEGFVELSQQTASGYYLDTAGQWGVMRREVWVQFVNYLIRHRLIVNRDGEIVMNLDINKLFTNQFVESLPAVRTV